MLEIKNFSKTYRGGRRAVDGLTLTVEPGSIFGFIGHNGAGKTTTIRAIAGALDFNEGEIRVCGVSVKDDPVTAKMNMAYIPDNPELYENLTGERYLRFISEVYRVPGEARSQRIKKYAEEFEILSRLGDPISSYSHGMKQKLTIISALVHEPKLLVLDEPFVGLDPKAAFVLKGLMHELTAAGGAIFFSTHVLDTAEKLCDRVAIIKNGRLVTEGTMDEVRGNESLEQVFLELTDNA